MLVVHLTPRWRVDRIEAASPHLKRREQIYREKKKGEGGGGRGKGGIRRPEGAERVVSSTHGGSGIGFDGDGRTIW